MGKHSKCVIGVCNNDMRNPELHKNHSNMDELCELCELLLNR